MVMVMLFLLSKVICSRSNFSSKRQSKIVKTSSKRILKSVHWNEYKTKSENKETTNKYRYQIELNFSNQILLEPIDYLF